MRKAGLNVGRRTEQYVNHANKGRRKLIFEPGDWVWLHMRKESFPYQRRSKLRQRRNGTFQVLERIKDNAYRLDLPVQSNVSVTFNVSDVRPSNTGDDLRANPLQEEANDEAKDPVLVPIGPVTRARSKRFKEDLHTLAQHIVIEDGK